MDKSKIALEDEIARAIMAENGCTAHFDCEDEKIYGNSMKGESSNLSTVNRVITVITYNPNTCETFLLKSVCEKTDEEGLIKISSYVQSHKIDYDSFTVSWAKKGEAKQSKSYFYCKDILEALDKFFFNKKREDYTIYSVNMNAKS